MSDELTIEIVIEDDGSIVIGIGDDNEDDTPILPCPCCGGKAMMNLASELWIECQECHLQTACYDNPQECLDDWNRRVRP